MTPTSPPPHRLGLALLALSAGLLPLAGCASTPSESGSSAPEAPARRSNAANRLNVDEEFVTVSDGIRINHRNWGDLGYRWEWSTLPLGKGRDAIEFISPMGDRIAVQSEDSWTAIVETATGRTDWQVRNASPLTEFVSNDRIGSTLISSSRPELFLMDINTGNLVSRQPVELVVTTPPILESGYAVFGTPTGQLYCHRFGTAAGAPLPPPLDDGIKAWGYSLDGAINAAPVKIGDLAGVVTEKGHVFFVDILSGSGRGTSRISGGMDTDPVTDGMHMFVASRDQSIYAFAPESSTYFWRERTANPITSQPTYHDGTLYCALEESGLVAFDVSMSSLDAGEFGARKWENIEVSGEVVAVQNGDLIVWDAPTLSRVDAQRGDVIASFTLDGVREIVASELEDSDLYAIGAKGQLIRFSAR